MESMTSTNRLSASSLPAVGRGLPTFTLRDTAGEARRLWDYKQRRPVLLTVLRDTDDALGHVWLERLAASRSILDEHRVAVLVVASEPVARMRELQSALDLPFTLLADPEGEVAARYLPAAPDAEALAVYLADRYLQCLSRWLVRDESGLPAVDAIAAALALADQDDCACGLPAWPED